MEFFSPIINMWIDARDYITFLKNPRFYMELPLEFVEMRTLQSGHIYPMARCGDIYLHLAHYKSFEEAVECWERRKKRINWDNIFVEMSTDDIMIANEFSELPYERKICFVPFETTKKSLIYLPYRNNKKLENRIIADIANGIASGEIPYLDILDLVKYGKITVIQDFNS